MRRSKFKSAATRLVRAVVLFECALVALLPFVFASPVALAQGSVSSSQLTPLQFEIERERRRLSSTETEERRDAVMRLGAMKRVDSARVAANGLHDASPIVRATAARAILSLPSDEAAQLLLPLLQDREEFVRQEAAYALGLTRSRAAVAALINILEQDKKDSVRGAAAVALGQIGDESAVIPLTNFLGRRVPASGILNRVRRKKMDENEFVRRAAAHSLGQIHSRAAVPALVDVLKDEHAPDDVRREAATSLGMIGGQEAIAALREMLTARDPYLSKIAYESLLKISPKDAMRSVSEDQKIQ
ncbi:MAG TPA: HEAT repeat domain-containing protein [Pyrinomonadaceae bacterium]|nr:HEAT repeat domain-containing protein [Pyrinomonadaceae bacterium]